jgi:hypothetical protein
VEALWRLLTQENLMSDLEAGVGTPVIKMFDKVMESGLWVISSIVPSFGRFSFANYVAGGYDVSLELVLQRSVHALAFLLPVIVAAHFFLKTREVAR